MAKSINNSQNIKKRDQNMIEIVAANILFFRSEQGLKQVPFANLADIEAKQLYNYENGLVDLGISSISNLAKALGMLPYELLVEREEALIYYREEMRKRSEKKKQ